MNAIDRAFARLSRELAKAKTLTYADLELLRDALALALNTMNAKDGPTDEERIHATVIGKAALKGTAP